MANTKITPIADSQMVVVKVSGKNRKHLEYLEETLRQERGIDSVLDVPSCDVANNAFEIAYWVKKNKVNLNRRG